MTIFTSHILLLILITGVFAGYVDAIAGGGGMFTMPMLLSIGLPPHVVLGTNKLAATLGVSQSMRVFIKKKIIRPRTWLIAVAFAFLGALSGSFIVEHINGKNLHKFLPVMMMIVIFYMYKNKFRSDSKSTAHFIPNKMLSAVTGTCIGFYDGFFGPGTGSLGIATLMSVFKLNLIEASGVTKILNFSGNFAALLTFIHFGKVNYYAGLTLGLTYMLGSYLGANFAINIDLKYLRPLVMSIAAIICINLIIHEWF